MNWLAPSLVAIATTVFFVCPIYLYLYFQEREKSLAIWAVGWLFYGCRFLIQLGLVMQLIPPWMIQLQQFCSVAGAVLFVYGTCYFIGRKFPVLWLLAAAASVLWALFSAVCAYSPLACDLPVSLFLCLAYGWSGYLIMTRTESKGAASRVTGWSLILWGTHKADYPFLRTVSWFVPWGYLIASLLFLLASIGILLIYYERVRHHLEHGQALLTSLIDSIPDLIFYKDQNSVYLGCNQPFSNFLGRSREKIIGYRDRDFFKQEMADFLRTMDLQMLEQGKPLHYEEWVPDPAGQLVPFDTLKTPYYGPTGRVLGLIGISRDITERKNIEEALKESEERFRAIFEQAAVGVALINSTTGRFVKVNQKYSEITGYLPGEIETLTVSDITHPDDLARDRTLLEQLSRGEIQEFALEKRCLRKDGRIIRVMLSVTSLRPAEGRPDYHIAVVEDVTAAKAALEALNQSETLLNEVGKIARIGGWEMDLVTCKSKWTKATYEIVGIEPGKPIPWPDEYLNYFLPEYHSVIEQAVRQLIEQGKPFDFEARLRTVKGAIIWCRTLGKGVLEGGKCLKIYGTFQDITGEKEAAAEKEALEKKFRQAQKMEAIGTLAGGIAHDFNNILVPIIGYAEVMMDSLRTDSRNRQDLQAILTAAKRARDLVKQILRFSREREKDVGPLLIGPIIKESIKLLSFSIPKNICINQEITSTELTVLADASQIHQLMMNLGANAYQAMRETGGSLDFSLREADAATLPLARVETAAGGRYLEIMVRDTGRGMDEATKDRIFEPYFTTKGKEEGTGLGLAVVHGIVHSLKGKIVVESEPGKGSSFYIYLPLFTQRCHEEHRAPDEDCPTGAERILVVDDEKSISEIMSRRLTKLGYEVTTRTSSIEALELFRHRPHDFDLVLTDQTMPNMTGDQLGTKLLAIRPDLPLILCTGYSSVIDQERARKIGFKAFLLKPIIRNEMARVIRAVLDGRDEEL